MSIFSGREWLQSIPAQPRSALRRSWQAAAANPGRRHVGKARRVMPISLSRQGRGPDRPRSRGKRPGGIPTELQRHQRGERICRTGGPTPGCKRPDVKEKRNVWTPSRARTAAVRQCVPAGRNTATTEIYGTVRVEPEADERCIGVDGNEPAGFDRVGGLIMEVSRALKAFSKAQPASAMCGFSSSCDSCGDKGSRPGQSRAPARRHGVRRCAASVSRGKTIRWSSPISGFGNGFPLATTAA